jgi:hypothetical protein
MGLVFKLECVHVISRAGIPQPRYPGIPGDTLDSNDHVRVVSQSCCVCMWNSSWSCSPLSVSRCLFSFSSPISPPAQSPQRHLLNACTSSHHRLVAHSPRIHTRIRCVPAFLLSHFALPFINAAPFHARFSPPRLPAYCSVASLPLLASLRHGVQEEGYFVPGGGLERSGPVGVCCLSQFPWHCGRSVRKGALGFICMRCGRLHYQRTQFSTPIFVGSANPRLGGALDRVPVPLP